MEHPKNCLVCSVNPPTARLEEWTYKPGDLIIWGKVYNDSKGRFPEGELIHTSQIKNIDFEGGHAHTLNSLYILGKRNVRPGDI